MCFVCAFFSCTAMKSERRADSKESAGTPQEDVTTNVMHGRKRAKLASSAFGKERVSVIDPFGCLPFTVMSE